MTITGDTYVVNYLFFEQILVPEEGMIFTSTRTRPLKGTLKSETKIFEYQRGATSDNETCVKRHKVDIDL